MSLPNFLNFNIKSPLYCPKPSASFNLHPAPSNLFLSSSKHFECPSSLFPPPNQSVAAIVFGDGSHSQLYPLTKRRSEAALPIAGNYRLVDAVVSNCINSNITKIYALTQFNSTSLNSHLSRAYSSARFGKDGGFVEVVAAYQSPEGKGWFQGSADAIRRCLWILEEYPFFELLVLPGYHLYKMDYQKVIEVHRNNNADITVAVSSNPSRQWHDDEEDSSGGFGFFHVNMENKVTSFNEKPETPVKINGIGNDRFFPSMGIYVVSRDAMIKLLTQHFLLANDLRSEIIPGAISLEMKVYAYKFDGYWEDMRNIEAYYRSNMESTKKTNNAYNFYDRDSPLYTLPRHLPPSLITDAVITDSAIGDGCILNRCRIKDTVVGMRTRVGEGAVIEDSVVLGSDNYESISREEEAIRTPIGIGEGSHIKKAIIDKNARIGKNVKILNRDNVQEGNNEAAGYIVSRGIVVILRSAVIPDGSIV
ncbi:PREDICTED: inactive glucose-1-phosphate adenylyltransferase small subunit 2, chloroplastic-like isoform X2 [Ipomoea nil]|uniref:inactive glucose-1-phosphate adenylyltransferase small subunit 2, chloroplastic-like isoform X2 n=1 Tax=Ipomoea nil TaxID=35883 RepID=UPI000900BE68|nr:PREDICTED: inactive glucose-1-phosphate adenylyltransferase small subunit 2, chloroplastic-like isoform X2 [Ipomoea nil]